MRTSSILLALALAAATLAACGCTTAQAPRLAFASATGGDFRGATRGAALQAEEAKRFDSVTAYLHFLKEFGSAPEAPEIRARLEAKAWRRTLESDTTAAYVIFVHDYPESRHVAEARAAIASLAYEQAAEEGTPDAYAAFLRAHPEALDAFEARQWLARHAPETLVALDAPAPATLARAP